MDGEAIRTRGSIDDHHPDEQEGDESADTRNPGEQGRQRAARHEERAAEGREVGAAHERQRPARRQAECSTRCSPRARRRSRVHSPERGHRSRAAPPRTAEAIAAIVSIAVLATNLVRVMTLRFIFTHRCRSPKGIIRLTGVRCPGVRCQSLSLHPQRVEESD